MGIRVIYKVELDEACNDFHQGLTGIMKMNVYDERYNIRLANFNDINLITDFIRDNWRKDHALASNRELFEYEFLEKDGSVNFVLAIDRKTEMLEAISGFLKASHDENHLDIWGVMWMTRPNNIALLGIELLKRRDFLTGCRTAMGVGDNPDTAVPLISKLMNRYVAKMNHYYILSDRKEYKIASVNEHNRNIYVNRKKYEIIHFESIRELTKYYDMENNINVRPYKDNWYIDHRYFKHISYKYDVCGIKTGLSVDAIIVLRNEWFGDRYVVRIVDYIGDQNAITGAGWYFEKLIEDNRCEYIDFYNLGFRDEYLKMAGFTLRSKSDLNIIPNFFHPFVQKNIDIWVDSTNSDTVFFKGDADQDRPN